MSIAITTRSLLSVRRDKQIGSSFSGGGGGGGGSTTFGGGGGSLTALELLTKLLTVDGTTSLLDADLLDGVEGALYARLASPIFAGTVTSPQFVARSVTATDGAVIINTGNATTQGWVGWYRPSSVRSAYMGAGTTDLLLVLENSSNLGILGGAVRINTAAGGGMLHVSAANVNSDLTAIHITNTVGKTYALTSGIRSANEQGFSIRNITDATTPFIILPNDNITINGGLHIGGNSDAGNNNLLVDGTATISNTTNSAITNYGGVLKNNYVSQLTGYRVSAAGEADFRYLYADQLHVKSFIADLEQALAGGQIIAKSVAKIAADFTIPAAGAYGNLIVEEFAGFSGNVFANGDMIRLRQFARANNTTLDVADVWGTVEFLTRNAAANPITQYYKFTRSSAPNAGSGSGTIKTGTLALDYGVSGNGYYEVTAVDGVNGANSPYSQFVTWTGHPATGLAFKARIGNLAGITDAAFGGALSGYGLYGDNVYLKGKIVISAGSGYANISDKPTTLNAIESGTGTKLTGIATGATVGAIWSGTGANLSGIPGTLGTPAGTGLFLSSTYMGYYTASAWTTFIKNDGTFAFAGDANNYVTWNGTTLAVKGNITATAGLIGGFTITSNELYAGSETTRIAMQAAGGFWAGQSLFADAPFSVTTAGVLKATSGVIGGWTINTAYLYKNTGTPATSSGMAPADYPFYAGKEYTNRATAPFRVTPGGALTATGVAELGTVPSTVDGFTQNLAIKNTDIYEPAYNGDGSAVLVNRIGYLGEQNKYRDFVVFDGKGNKTLQVVGSATPHIYLGNDVAVLPVTTTACGPFIVQGNFTAQYPATCSQTLGVTGVATFSSNIILNNTNYNSLNTTGGIYMGGSTQGLYLTKMTTATRDALAFVDDGLMIYNTTTGQFNVYVQAAWKRIDVS